MTWVPGMIFFFLPRRLQMKAPSDTLKFGDMVRSATILAAASMRDAELKKQSEDADADSCVLVTRGEDGKVNLVTRKPAFDNNQRGNVTELEVEMERYLKNGTSPE